MKVFVTGATGFIGRALSERLIDEGHAVRALARESASISSLEHLDLEIVPGDIRDADVVERAMDGCEHVYHLAAATSWSRTRPEYAAVNVEGTRNVARAAWKTGVRRLVYASTVGVYGSLTSPPLDESTPPRPDSRYRETKLAGEEVVLSWQRKERLPVVIARLATTFGPGSLRWLNWIRTIAAGRFRTIGSGENRVHEVHISDAVEGLRLCAEAGSGEGRTYVLAGREATTLNRLVETISRELGTVPPSRRWPAAPFQGFRRLTEVAYRTLGCELPFAGRYDLFLSDRVFSIARAREELGYRPQVHMLYGMKQMVEWYRERVHVECRPSSR